MAIDPKAAAAAAQAAAAAAKAAAEAAAAAAAEADAATTTAARPTLADDGTTQRLEDTGVTAGSELGGDGSQLDGLRDASASLGDGERASLAELPGLTSVTDRGTGLTGPSLGGSFQSGGGSFDKSMISDNALAQAVGSTPFYSDGGSDAGTSDAGPATKLDPIVKINTDGTVERMNEDGVYHDDGGVRPGDDVTTTKDVKTDQIEGGAVKGEGPGAWEYFKGLLGFGSDDDADAGADGGTTGTDGGTTGADAGGGTTDVPPGEQEVVLPPGWIDPDDLDFIDDDRKTGGIVAGGTGRDPDDDGGDATTPGPQGGDWAINPGAEGFVAGRETDLRDAKEWYGGVSQPGDPSLEPVSGNPAMLDQGIQVVDPNTVNPSGGEGTTSDGEAQASTAYRTMESAGQDGIESTDAADIADTGYESDATMPVDDSGGQLTGATAESADAPEDRASPFSMPAVDDDARHGQGHGYGRDGEKGSHGRGRDDQDEDLE